VMGNPIGSDDRNGSPRVRRPTDSVGASVLPGVGRSHRGRCTALKAIMGSWGKPIWRSGRTAGALRRAFLLFSCAEVPHSRDRSPSRSGREGGLKLQRKTGRAEARAARSKHAGDPGDADQKSGIRRAFHAVRALFATAKSATKWGPDSAPDPPANTLTFQAKIRLTKCPVPRARHHARDDREEMKRSYPRYAMSVNRGSRFTRCCDGLKPVHRRISVCDEEGVTTITAPSANPRVSSARSWVSITPMATRHLRRGWCYGAGFFHASHAHRTPGQFRFDGRRSAGGHCGTPKRARALGARRCLGRFDKQTVPFQPNYDGAELEPQVPSGRSPHL